MNWVWHGHLQAYSLVRQNNVGEHLGDDMDLVTLWLIVISYINNVGLLLFPPFGSMSGWLLVWIFLSTGGTLASDIPVAYSAIC